MGDIRTSSLGGVPFGTSETRPSNPIIGQTYFNGTLGVQEIYTASGWLPATGANDFNVTLAGPVTTATFTKEYFAGAYTINSALVDSTYDIYVYYTAGNQVGYTKSPSLSATGNFNKIVVIGGSAGDLLSFSYKTTFIATNTTSQVTAGAFITSVTPTALNSIDDTTTISGGNFASNVAVYFVGSDNVERAAKSIVRSSSSQLIVTRPDTFSTQLGTYKVVVENPGITRPTGSSLHVLNNAITAGTTPNWTTGTTLSEIAKNIAYTTTLLATDSEGTDIDYSIISGTLPAGITLNNETGVLSGTYTGADFNTTNLLVRAVDTGGNTVDRTFRLFSLNPVWVTAATLPGYLSNTAYSTTLSATDDNVVSYALQSGTLPTGITLNGTTGVISGTSSATSSFTFTIRATDSVGNFTDRAFTLSLALGMSAAAPATNGVQLWDAGYRTSGLYYITTSQGVKQVYVDLSTTDATTGKAGWMLVGSWGTAWNWTLPSTTSSSVFSDTPQNCFSTNFGGMNANFMRVHVADTISQTGASATSADWYYYNSTGATWREWWVQNSSNAAYSSNGFGSFAAGLNNGTTAARDALRPFNHAYNLKFGYQVNQNWNNLADPTGTQGDWWNALNGTQSSIGWHSTTDGSLSITFQGDASTMTGQDVNFAHSKVGADDAVSGTPNVAWFGSTATQNMNTQTGTNGSNTKLWMWIK